MTSLGNSTGGSLNVFLFVMGIHLHGGNRIPVREFRFSKGLKEPLKKWYCYGDSFFEFIRSRMRGGIRWIQMEGELFLDRIHSKNRNRLLVLACIPLEANIVFERTLFERQNLRGRHLLPTLSCGLGQGSKKERGVKNWKKKKPCPFFSKDKKNKEVALLIKIKRGKYFISFIMFMTRTRGFVEPSGIRKGVGEGISLEAEFLREARSGEAG